MLRGRLGEAFGSFGGVLGGFWELLEPLETPLGASGASQGGSWVLPEHLREALGSSRDALGSVSGCFSDVSGSLFGLRESGGSGQDAKVEIIVSLRNSFVFEVPVAPKASQNHARVVSRGLVERAKVASSVFGKVTSRKVAPKRRKPAEPSGTRRNPAETSLAPRRVKSKSLSKWLRMY